MTGNSSSDESDPDDSFSTSKIKPKWMEAQRQNNFFDEEWPNTLRSENSASSGISQSSIADIIKLIRNQSHTKNVVQNGQNDSTNNVQDSAPGISHNELARISSTIDKQDLQNIIGSASTPQLQHPPPPPPLPHPQPPPAPPAALRTPNVVPRPYFNASQPPPPAYYPPQSYYPTNAAHPNIAAYIAPTMAHSIPTQFIPNGSPIGWSAPRSHVHHGAPMPFNTHPNQIHQPHAHSMRADPRLQPRPHFHQNQKPPMQSTPIQRPGKPRLGPTNRPTESPPVKHITYGDYRRRNQSNQSDVNMAQKVPSAARAPDSTCNNGNNNVAVVPEIDPKSSNNNNNNNNNIDDGDDDASNEPTFSPAAVSNASSPASVAPTPPPQQNENENERIPDDEFPESSVEQDDVQCLPSVKKESEQCESDAATDYSSDSTMEFTYENLKRVEGLRDEDDSGELISNGNVTAPSTEQMHEETNGDVHSNSLHTQHTVSVPKISPQVANQSVPPQQHLATSMSAVSPAQKQQKRPPLKTKSTAKPNGLKSHSKHSHNVDVADPPAPTVKKRSSKLHDKAKQPDDEQRDILDLDDAEITPAKNEKAKIKRQIDQNVLVNNLDEIEDELKNMEGIEPTHTPDDAQNVKKVQKPPEIETNQRRCVIYLMDIRDTGLFDKYLKKADHPTKPPDEPKMAPADESVALADESMAPADDMFSIDIRSPIEIPDSDDENDDSSSCSGDSINDPKVVVISDSE